MAEPIDITKLSDEDVARLTSGEQAAPDAAAAGSGAIDISKMSDAQVRALTSNATPESGMGLLESFGRGAAEGATFGFDDKLGLDKERREASKKINPWTHFLGEMAGSTLPMVGTGGIGAVAKGAGMLPRAGRAVAAVMAPGEISTLGQAAFQGGKLGAVYGGLSGAGHADVKPEDTYAEAAGKRLWDAGKGAVAGAAVGAPLGVVGHGVFKAAESLGGIRAAAKAETDLNSGALVTAAKYLKNDQITPDEMIARIRADFPDDTAKAGLVTRFWGGLQNKQPITADQVEEVVRRAAAGESATEISNALKASMGGQGPGVQAIKSLLKELEDRHLGPMTILDRAAMTGRPGSGENTQWTMRAAAATPGPAKAEAREMLVDRQLGANTRISDFLSKALGNENFEAAVAAHEAKMGSAADRMYGAARANEQPFDLNPIFAKWEAAYNNKPGDIPSTILAELNKMRTTQAVVNPQGQLAKQPPGGIVNKAPAMDLDGFMLSRDGLWATMQAAKKAENKGLYSRLSKLYGELTDEVAKTNPLWKEANDFFRDGALAKDAAKAGADMSLRLNNSSREGLKDFTNAVAMEKKAQAALGKAEKTLEAATKRNDAAAMATAQVEVDRLAAKVDAAQAAQELYKTGLMRSISDKYLVNEGETHNLTKQLLKPGAKNILREVLRDDADAVIRKLEAEAAMHRTYSAQFGSQTTPLREHIDDMKFAPTFDANLANPLKWPSKILDLAAQYAANNINARRNTDLMKLYTETDPLKQIEILEAMKALQTARSNAGNLFGKPTVGLGSGSLPQFLVGGESNHQRVPPRKVPKE